jgi:hypothetical protein
MDDHRTTGLRGKASCSGSNDCGPSCVPKNSRNQQNLLARKTDRPSRTSQYRKLKKETFMSTNAGPLNSRESWLLSLDSWAVVAALLAALLIRAGVFTRVPW